MPVQQDIKLYAEKVLKNADIQNYYLELEGDENKKGDGYVGDIFFVNAIGKNKKGDNVEYKLVLKCSKVGTNIKDLLPIDVMFDVETYTYTQVLPIFNKMQCDKLIKNEFSSIPKCFGAIQEEDRKVIVFENLKKEGYELWPRQKPITLDHTKKILEEYGKWHAFSFVLRDQKPDLFRKLSENRPNTFKMLVESTNLHKANFKDIEFIKKVLLKDKLTDKMLKSLEKIENNLEYIYTEMYKEDNEFASISHGDCWNNNFMYKYKVCLKSGKKVLDAVKIIDWQCSTLAPPVIDVSHFFYSTSGKEQFDIYEDLLSLYYTSFSNFAKQLGSDPEKIYPYSKFMEQWKRFSRYGFVLACIIYKFGFAEEKDIPNFDGMSIDDPNRDEIFDIKVDLDLYKARIEILWEHYLNTDIL